MELQETNLEGCIILHPKTFRDKRGSLTKIYHQDIFKGLGLDLSFKEEYFSVSTKGVLRGLHFQTPPMQHSKCVTCVAGSIYDVVVDLRKKSPTYGDHFSLILDSKEPTMLLVPEGFAHGFVALEDNSVFLNRSTTVYSPDCDAGIRWDSCGIQWPDMDLIISDKDSSMPSFENYDSPF